MTPSEAIDYLLPELKRARSFEEYLDIAVDAEDLLAAAACHALCAVEDAISFECGARLVDLLWSTREQLVRIVGEQAIRRRRAEAGS